MTNAPSVFHRESRHFVNVLLNIIQTMRLGIASIVATLVKYVIKKAARCALVTEHFQNANAR